MNVNSLRTYFEKLNKIRLCALLGLLLKTFSHFMVKVTSLYPSVKPFQVLFSSTGRKKKPQYSRCFTSIFIYINIRIAGGLDSQNNTKTKHGDEDVEAKQEDVTSSQGPFHQPPAWVHPLWDLGRRGTPPRACLNQTS